MSKYFKFEIFLKIHLINWNKKLKFFKIKKFNWRKLQIDLEKAKKLQQELQHELSKNQDENKKKIEELEEEVKDATSKWSAFQKTASEHEKVKWKISFQILKKMFF